MVHDPLRRLQLDISGLLRRNSFETTRLDKLDDAGRERHYRSGAEQIANLSERIRTQTGFVVDSCSALDFGCGVGRAVLPLAERCEHVYGLDVSPAVLREGERQARARNLSNIDWMDAARLPELAGRYDLVISFFVFQHIPSREGERIFAALLAGLRPGGAGAIHLTLAPKFRGSIRTYLYERMNSYSLSRLALLLGDAGVTEWHSRVHSRPAPADGRASHQDVTIIFRKDRQPANSP
jgi:cyclopropane fatty-acyl-phospholipid synthase-like methyltransferase